MHRPLITVRRETEPDIIAAVYDETEAVIPGGMGAVIRGEPEPWTHERWQEACRLSSLLLVGFDGEPIGWLLLELFQEDPERIHVHACRWPGTSPRYTAAVWRQVRAGIPAHLGVAAFIEQDRPRIAALARRLGITVEDADDGQQEQGRDAGGVGGRHGGILRSVPAHCQEHGPAGPAGAAEARAADQDRRPERDERGGSGPAAGVAPRRAGGHDADHADGRRAGRQDADGVLTP